MADSMKSLVVFVAILAIAGLAVGGACYVAIDLPQQKALEENPPDNAANPGAKCDVCRSNCMYASNYYQCLSECDLVCSS